MAESGVYLTKEGLATVLSFVGAGGVVATAVAATKAKPKADKAVRDYELKHGRATKVQRFCLRAPAYIPVVAAGGFTVACIFGSDKCNKNVQAGLMGAISFAGDRLREYEKTILDEIGVEKAGEIRGRKAEEKARTIMAHPKRSSVSAPRVNDPVNIYLDFCNLHIVTSYEKLVQALTRANDFLVENGYLTINYVIEPLGYRLSFGDMYGWSAYDGECFYGWYTVPFTVKPMADHKGTWYTVTTAWMPSSTYCDWDRETVDIDRYTFELDTRKRKEGD